MSAHVVGVVAAVLTAAVLLLSGVAKLGGAYEWRSQSEELGVPWPVAWIVPYVEVTLGALLLVQWQRHVVAWCAVALLSSFTVLIIVRLAQGRRAPCACFGEWSDRPLGVGHLARNAVLIAVAVMAAVL
jgi:uncharacterized membrane protein YphA (DoxX/SURF4 family)